MKTIEEIFPEGGWKGPDEYVIRCPVCLDHPTHSHCSLNPEKRRWHCFYCGAGGSLDKFLVDYGDGQKLIGTWILQEKQEKKEWPKIDFDSFLPVNEVLGGLGIIAQNYLFKRGLSTEDISEYNIRYAISGRYYGRVLIPICENKKVVNFSARSFLNFVKPKYLFPHKGETILEISEIIFNYEQTLDNLSDQEWSMFIFTEGIFDALAVERAFPNLNVYAMALLSKNMSDSQLLKLLRLPKEKSIFTILLDPDAYQDALKIAKKINSYGRNVYVANLKGAKDPGEATQLQLADAICSAKLYDTDLELEALLFLLFER